jgi:hypothetical protein
MKKRLTRPAAKPLSLLAVAAALVCLAQPRAHAQKPSPQQSNPPDAGSRYPNGDMEVRALELEREKASKRDPNAILGEVNEDLRRLQAINEEMTRRASPGGQQLDYKYVLDSTAEVRKRALRLKTDLALPQGAKEEKRNDLKGADNGQLQPGLDALNKLLDGFLHNPIFSGGEVGALDPHLTAQARRDLDDIISLSDKLHKTADKLNKSGSK